MEASAPPRLDSSNHSGDVPVTSSSTTLGRIASKLFKLWASLQVSYYGGKYSIERALALDEYTRTTSLLRVIVVCLGTPLPMITLVFLQELLPLQDPADGWSANYGFWIRLLMLSAVTANTFLVQGTFMVADFTLSWRQLVLFIIGLSLIHTAASMAVSATLFFPIPFFYVTMTPSFYIPLFTLLYFMMGKNSTNCMCYIATQKIMGMVYPAYQLLFHKAVSTRYVLPVVLLQPVIKIVAKNIVLHFTKQLEDLTPEAVIFTVDFYNSLYLSTFMESASTVTTMMILIGTDVTQTLLVLVKMQRRTETILQRLHHTANAFADEDLLSSLCLLCRNQDQLATQTHEGVRVRSCLAQQLSPADNNLLFMLEKPTVDAPHSMHCWPTVAGPFLSCSTIPGKPTSPVKRIQQALRIRCSSAVAPTTTNTTNSRRRSVRLYTSEMKTFREGSRVLSANRTQHSDILRETLTTLYTMECLVLTAYLEALIPVLYGNYLIVMVHFPNAAYHTELKNVTRQNVDYRATVVFLFGLLQFMSFGLLAGLIHRKCGMNVLYQLAFVLETQMSLVQGKLVIWMLVTLACRVTHFAFMISPSLEDARHRSGVTSTPTNFCERVHAGYSRLIRLWTSLQVSYHGGKYSIERVLALDKYTRTTSLSRVVAVCVGTPLPMVTLVAIQEFLPLQEPQDGWDKNYGFWFRVCMLGAAVSHTYLVQGKYMVDDFAHSSGQVLLFVVGISALYTLSGILVAANIVFPIPFYYITMTPAFYAPLLTLLYSILGNNTKLNKYVSFIVTQKAMGMLYPLYQLLFRKASDRQYVLPVILLLPVVKVMVKNVVLHFTSHLEDLTPEAVIFTVDFYNALYLATCMESASTLEAMVIFIGTDFAQTVTVLTGMHRRTASVLPRLCQAAGAPPRSTLLSASSLICRNPAIFETQLRGGVQVHSCFQHKLDREDRRLLSKLEKLPVCSSSLSRIQCWSPKNGVVVETPTLPKLRFASFSNSFSKLGSAHKIVAVQPITPSTPVSKRRQGRVAGGPNGIPTDLIEHSNILRETLEVLYTTECLVLTAYLEAFIPLFYCGYMMFMVQLPNAKFHTELSSVTRQNVEYTARVVFLFGLLQVFSFMLLMGLVQRNCKLRILYNLAFVLETQMSLVQGKLMIWMLVTLACRVVHFGTLKVSCVNAERILTSLGFAFSKRCRLLFPVQMDHDTRTLTEALAAN